MHKICFQVDYLTTIGYDYESKKPEKFLDISLNIKEFGNEVPMNSVTESLESYLKPEKLEGDNQVSIEPTLSSFCIHACLRLIPRSLPRP